MASGVLACIKTQEESVTVLPDVSPLATVSRQPSLNQLDDDLRKGYRFGWPLPDPVS